MGLSVHAIPAELSHVIEMEDDSAAISSGGTSQIDNLKTHERTHQMPSQIGTSIPVVSRKRRPAKHVRAVGDRVPFFHMQWTIALVTRKIG